MNGIITCTVLVKWLQESIPYALMIAFGMVMRHVFLERSTKRALAEKNHSIEALVLD